MSDPTLLAWGVSIVLAIQTIASPVLDTFFLAVNFIQSEDFFLIALPILYWCLDQAITARLAFIFLLSSYANAGLKDLFHTPRPFTLDPRVRALDPLTDPAFPSGGTQATTVFWGYLWTQYRTRVLAIITIIAIPLIAFTRMYLGAHHPQDVVGGFVIGALLIAIYLALQPRVVEWLKARGFWLMLAAAIVFPLVLALLYLTSATATGLGALLGFGVGIVLETRYVRFSPRAVWWKQVVKVVAGLAVALALRFALKAVLPPAAISDLVRYTFIGVWMSLGAPWMFVAAKLAQRREEQKG